MLGTMSLHKNRRDAFKDSMGFRELVLISKVEVRIGSGDAATVCSDSLEHDT